ncbi:CcmD family protein [Hymenobacter busanensis]|uniref:CcmD family protein n=1 Tax=Hymenobacter busanensis TaxID=2607656 RepID=A0A7L5A1K9_9BACT|nr:CcmD family protein [Hymenobacter busanensis]QHJ09674.1 CcmD family protein [Hymenobacter busanensis]
MLLLAAVLLPALAAVAQQPAGPEMADQFRQDGKIYVVVGVIVIVLLGLLAYLVSIDRKVGRLERELRD